jgi:hypothetical protein
MANVKQFVEEFKNKKITNTSINENAVNDYLREQLEINEYIPFNEKRMIAEMVVASNTDVIDGVKKYDSINAHVLFIVDMLEAHTNLEFSDDYIDDYDMLAENGLIAPILEMFSADYAECNDVLKMALEYEMADNNLDAIVGRFFNGLYGTLDGVGDSLKNMIDKVNISELIGAISKEDLAKLRGILNKLK